MSFNLAQRKNLKADISTLSQITHLLNYKKKTFIEHSSETDFNNALDYVNKTIAKLENKRQKLPIGHRYTGVFYLKKPYTVPSEAVKIKGSAFMREDLVSWTIESDDEYVNNVYYVREVYLDKEMTKALKREDCKAVFEEN
ncbi:MULTISPECIES: hypothetical protein [Cysteiniphilum]|uniref:hypothetical protein n=1 Tax=Cysteiniphilum TaxID=2056696 RepID=UPI001786F085|nr:MULTISPECIES: hypothetical protein [Cysteiniphilum]